jgi:hypothetical protein
MVVTPVLRGLFGLEAKDRGRTIEIAPSLPADWDRAAVRGFAAGTRRVDVEFRRVPGALEIRVSPAAGDQPAGTTRLDLAPSLPLDARVVEVRADGKPIKFQVERIGDVQRVLASVDLGAKPVTIRAVYEGGTEVFVRHEKPIAGAPSEGLRVIRSRAENGTLDLVLEGLGGQTYDVGVHGNTVGVVEGVSMAPVAGGSQTIRVSFAGAPATYVRRELKLPIQPTSRKR